LLLVMGIAGTSFYFTNQERKRQAILEQKLLFIKADHCSGSGDILEAIELYHKVATDYSGLPFTDKAINRSKVLQKMLRDSGTRENTPEREEWLCNYKSHKTEGKTIDAIPLSLKAEILEQSGDLIGAMKCYELIIKFYPRSGFAKPAQFYLNGLQEELQQSETKDNTPEREAWLSKYKTTDRKELAAKYYLKCAKFGLVSGRKEIALSSLKVIIKNYPNTEAAKEAKKLLDELRQDEKPK